MRKIFLLLFFSNFYILSYTQIIKGNIYDLNSGSVISFANVYFNATYVGTTSDQNGYFELDISGNTSMPLIISALGYYSLILNDISIDKMLQIYLKPKVFELDEITVTANYEDYVKTRRSNIELFKKVFLGVTPSAQKCIIFNENDIRFNYKVEEKTLSAFSLKPIIIENKALGYSITYYLDKFEFNQKNNSLLLTGNYIFQEKNSNRKILNMRFENKRQRVFLGSRMHFFRALWKDELESSGFSVRDSLNRILNYNNIVFQADNVTKYLKNVGTLFIIYSPKKQKSTILIKNEAYFNKNGYFNPFAIRWKGDMTQQRIADMLPFDYLFEPKKNLPIPEKKGTIEPADDDSVQLSPQVDYEMNKVYTIKRKQDLFISSFYKPETVKVFLHLDRTSFLKGDTIWYKAYLWKGYEQHPDNQSILLYVVLRGADGKVVQKKKLPVQNGTAIGEFTIEKYIKPGSYSICAYTNPAENINYGEPFCQNITISESDLFFLLECNPVFIKNETNDSLQLGLRFYEMEPGGELRRDYFHNVTYSMRIGNRIIRKDSIRLWNTQETEVKCRVPVIQHQDTLMVVNLNIKSGERDINKNFFIPLSGQPDIQFFPEGGSFIYGLESKVAFKAIGQDGLSREVKACIRDQNGKEMVRFESSYLGMGYFLFTPDAGMKYTSYVQFKGIEYQYPLPEPLKEGYVMRLNQNGETGLPEITVNSTSSSLNEVKYIAGTSYGKVRFVSEMNINSGEGHFIIPVDSFPEGIARITVLDSTFIPECERLVFVDKSQRINYMIVPDSGFYKKRSEVNLMIKAFDAYWHPIQTNLSISVVDAGQVLPDDNQSGIIAYKLLESELKGHIEKPGGYINDDGTLALKELDLLLLTQGYRSISVQRNSFSTNRLDQDSCFYISGKVEIRANQKQKDKYDYTGLELTLLVLDKMYLAKTNPDIQGNFKFQIPFVYGKPVVVIQARNSKGKLLNGDITLNMVTDEPHIPVMSRKDSLVLTTPEYVQHLQTAKKVMVSRATTDASMFLDLPEVTVKGRDKSMDFNFEEEAVWIPNLDSLDPDGYRYKDVFDLLVKEFGAIYERDSATNMIWFALLPSIGQFSSAIPVFLIDGFLVLDGDIT